MNERFTSLLQKPWVIPTAVGVVSLAAGTGIGYILGKRRNVAVAEVIPFPKYPESNQLALDFEKAGRALVEQHKAVVIEEQYAFPPEDIPDNIVKNPRMDPRDIVVVEQPNIITNVFAGTDDEWDYEAELSTRFADIPYVIHKDEFYADEMGYGQTTLTYYEGDDILVDEKEIPIHNHSGVVGEALMFGHGSGDKNVVYIRNERLGGDYEILRDTSSYEVEVLGLTVEKEHASQDLRHSKHTALRFRPE